MVKIGDKELTTLGRGKFVGERTLVTGKLRSASCVAQTRVTAIVMKKKEFLDLSNPMLDWMIPYDAARAVLTHQPEVKELTSDQFDMMLDSFDPKQEVTQNTQLVPAGSRIDQLWVFITGTVELRDADGKVNISFTRSGNITMPQYKNIRISAGCPNYASGRPASRGWRIFIVWHVLPV